MFCRSCGTQNPDGATSCSACGAQLDGATNPYAASEAQMPGNQSPAPGPKPENYLVQSIAVTLCCCLPLGIVSIIFAAQVDSKWNAGDFQGAMSASANAKKWSWIAFGLGLVANIIVVLIQIAAVGAAGNANNPGGF